MSTSCSGVLGSVDLAPPSLLPPVMGSSNPSHGHDAQQQQEQQQISQLWVAPVEQEGQQQQHQDEWALPHHYGEYGPGELDMEGGWQNEGIPSLSSELGHVAAGMQAVAAEQLTQPAGQVQDSMLEGTGEHAAHQTSH